MTQQKTLKPQSQSISIRPTAPFVSTHLYPLGCLLIADLLMQIVPQAVMQCMQSRGIHSKPTIELLKQAAYACISSCNLTTSLMDTVSFIKQSLSPDFCYCMYRCCPSIHAYRVRQNVFHRPFLVVQRSSVPHASDSVSESPKLSCTNRQVHIEFQLLHV